MKKFLCKLLDYILLMSVIIAVVNIVYINRENKGAEKMLNIPNGIQICNFGSSHGLNGFNYEDAEKNYVCFNFALGSQPLLYDERLLRHYRHKIQEGAYVFIVVSHFSLFGIPAAESLNFPSMNRRYYKFLPPELIERYDSKTDFYVNYMPALVSDNIIKFFETMLIPTEDLWAQVTNREYAQKHGKIRYRTFIAEKKDINGARIYNHEALKELYSMIEICRQIRATPILITTPYLKEYSDAVKQNDPEFYSDFYSVIEKVMKDTGVKYYDYSSDERLCNDYSLFFNSDHLNKKGARIFTNNLLLEVLGINVLPQ